MKNKLSYVRNNMRSYRNRVGLNQQEVADILNVSRQTYCSYETNPQKLELEVFQKLADVFGCEVKDFFMEYEVTQSDNKELEN